MTAPRPYRRPVNAAVARSELARFAGTPFGPDVVLHFLAVGLPKLRTSMGLLSWLAQIPFVRSWPKLQSTPGVAVSQAGTATLVASTTGAMRLTPAAAAPVIHDVSASPLSPATTAPVTTAPAAPHVEAARTHHVAQAQAQPQAPTSATAAVTGSSTAGAVTAPSTKPATHVAPTPTSCAPHDHGKHYGWVHRKKPPKHDGCG